MGIEYIDKTKCRLVVYNGTDMHGKQKRFKKTVTYTSKRNAEKQYREFENEVKNGLVSAGNITLDELMTDVIESLELKGKKPTTIQCYRMIQKRVVKTLGNPKAKNVQPNDLEKWVKQMIKMGYAPKTIHSTFKFVQECYKKGIALRILNHNPCDNIELPQKMVTHPRKVLTESSVISFLRALNEITYKDIKVALELALFVGLRRSEICALTYEDIDFTNNTVNVSSARNQVGANIYTSTTKTVGSTRTLALPSVLVDDIKELIEEQEERHRLCGTECEYLIQSKSGAEIQPNSINKVIKQTMTDIGFEGYSLHGLRHSCATMMANNGFALAEVSSQLGHSEKSTTLNIYTHLFRPASASSTEYASRIDNLVGSSLE